MNFINALGFWPWLWLLSIPPLIVLLYFLKLKRQPLEVPSTYLWHRTIEDLHVNSIWQRLRRSLLLLLQLLLIALIILACVRPGWKGGQLVGERFIFLIDNSASMNATDQGKTRLETAKDRIAELIDQMKSGDVAMLISFSDRAKVNQPFTDNRAVLRRELDNIRPSNHLSNLRDALRAADGLANPGQASISIDEGDATIDVEIEAKGATLYIVSDGGFSSVSDFALGNLEPIYVPIGDQQSPRNVGIVTFTAERNPEKPGQLQAFAEIENFGSEDAQQIPLSLYVNDTLRDADVVNVPAASTASAKFDLIDDQVGAFGEGTIRLKIQHDDHLALDNVAYAVVNLPRQARVLLVSSFGDALRIGLDTEELKNIAQVSSISPPQLSDKQHLDAAAGGAYDLIIYDACQPSIMPQANTLLIGGRPPLEQWTFGPQEDIPIVVDTDKTHPLMQLIEFRNVEILDGFSVQPPLGGVPLIESSIGTLMAIGPRDGFEDAVLGFEIIGEDENGRAVPKTSWPKRESFPVFLHNVVTYLGGSHQTDTAPNIQPGSPATLRSRSPVQQIQVKSPRGQVTQVEREAQSKFIYHGTGGLGIYSVREGSGQKIAQRFAVNLFDPRESNVKVVSDLQIGQSDIQGQSSWQPARKELWKWALLLGLVVLVLEWYVYNQRVHL